MTQAYVATDGASYERFLGRWTRRLAEPFIDFARPEMRGPLLDAGCATGSVASALAARGAAVVGVDIAAPYVDYARRACPAGRFEVASLDALPFRDGSFAACLAQLVLNFLPDAAAGAREMLRVTRSGGVVAAAVWDFRGGLMYQRVLWDTAAGIDPDAAKVRGRLFGHPLGWEDGLADLLRRAGAASVTTLPLTIRMEFESFDDYWEPLVGGQGPPGAYVAGRAPELRARVRAAVRDAYLSGGPDGPRSMVASAWAARGLKP